MLENINFSAFKIPITSNLINNITKETCSVLANILAIDYNTRLNSAPIITEYIDECIGKLKSFLGHKVITDDSFATAMTLFAIAISKESIDYQNKNNIIKQTQDAAVEVILNEHFEDSNVEDKKKIRLILKSLLNNDNRNDILNQINSDPQFIKTITTYALKKYERQTEINNYVNVAMKEILDKSIKLGQKIHSVTEATSKIITGACILALGALSVVTAGIALSIAIVPASILTMKYAPKIGEKIGQIIMGLDNNILDEQKEVKTFKMTFIQDIKNAFQQIEESKTQNTTQSLDAIHGVKLNVIKDLMSSYIGGASNPQKLDTTKTKEISGRTI